MKRNSRTVYNLSGHAKAEMESCISEVELKTSSQKVLSAYQKRLGGTKEQVVALAEKIKTIAFIWNVVSTFLTPGETTHKRTLYSSRLICISSTNNSTIF